MTSIGGTWGKSMEQFQKQIEQELCDNLLTFWTEQTVDVERGGFYGRITNDTVIDRDAPKGLILNTRILWGFSRAYNHYRSAKYLDLATRAYQYLLKYFWDQEHGGLYWLVDARGIPLEKRKQIYGQVFGIYGFSEYYTASGNADALNYARQIYELLERQALDVVNNGYVEAMTEDWQETGQLSLSDVDLNEKKSMNTHLHLLEAYTNLYRVWPDAILRQRLKNSINLMLDHILISQTGHFGLFFDEEWNLKSETISFGHEIEGVWLIHDAVILLHEPEYQQRVEKIILDIAEIVYQKALEPGGGGQWVVNEEYASGERDPGKVWWVQAEACVGFLTTYQLTQKPYFLEAVQQIWIFIQNECVDKQHGEWFWYVPENGVVDHRRGKVDAWKGPYHNVRACIEMLERLREMN